MSGRILKNRRTKSSKIFCEERYCCEGENEEAVFECDECGTKQCITCDEKLHQVAKFEAHERREVQGPPKEKLCQLKCTDKNYADVKCSTCGLNFCHDCFDKMHAHGRRKQHEKVRLTFPKSKPLPPKIDSKEAVAEVTENIAALKPISPIEDDDSLTYLSMPQAQDQNFEGGDQDDITVLIDSETVAQRASKPEQAIDIGTKDNDTIPVNRNPFSPEILGLGQNSSDMDFMGSLSLEDDTFALSNENDSVTRDISDEDIYNECNSFLLADQNEQIQVLEFMKLDLTYNSLMQKMMEVVHLFLIYKVNI